MTEYTTSSVTKVTASPQGEAKALGNRGDVDARARRDTAHSLCRHCVPYDFAQHDIKLLG